ncbi:MAG: TolC family protein [Candidatus Manganitrophus sp. SA1]|nr:TolC family protein [Candidatus Manganitrophus morganii]
MKRLLLSFAFLIGVFWIPIASSAAEETPVLVLNLEEVLREAAERNPEILEAENRKRAAAERIPQATAWDDPQVGVTQWSIPSNFSIGDADETWYTLSQTFPFFGKRTLRGNVAELDGKITAEDARSVRLKVIREVKQAYYALFFAHQALDIHHRQVELAQTFSRITQEKVVVGEAGQQDLLRAQVELLKLLNAVSTLEQEREAAEARLNTLLNRSTNSPLGVPQAVTIPTFEPKLETLQQEAEQVRPENRMQALAIRRGGEEVKSAKRDLFPDVMAEVAYWDDHDGPNRWMASIKINIPWINKKKYEAHIRENEAERQRAEAALQGAINQTALRVKELLVRFESSRRLARLYESGILPLAEQQLSAATIGYQSKKNDFLTLIDAQKNLRDLELTYFGALVDTNKSLAELEEMVGREF